MKQARLEIPGVPRAAVRPPAPAFIPGAPGAAPATSGPDQSTLNDAMRSSDWLFHGHDYSGTRFSPLQEINAGNAARLAPACMFQMGERDSFQTGPIVYNGTMYVTTQTTTIALDAATCRGEVALRMGAARGRAVGRKIAGWRSRTGASCGERLTVICSRSTRRPARSSGARHVANVADGETFTMAPVIFEDLVLIGPAGSENNLQGWVGAFRLADGTPVWRFNTIPKPGEPGSETWKNPAKHSRRRRLGLDHVCDRYRER